MSRRTRRSTWSGTPTVGRSIISRPVGVRTVLPLAPLHPVRHPSTPLVLFTIMVSTPAIDYRQMRSPHPLDSRLTIRIGYPPRAISHSGSVDESSDVPVSKFHSSA